jgi:hypothetical protein
MVTVIGILTGVLLGTRYKVLCLVPVTLAGTAALAALDRFNGVPSSSTALTALALVLGLQIGYLAGVVARSLLLAAFASLSLAELSPRATGRQGSPDFLKHCANPVARNPHFEPLEKAGAPRASHSFDRTSFK